MDITISTIDQSLSANCYEGGAIQLTPDELATLPDCDPKGTCNFVVTARNSLTGTIYSQTEFSISMTVDATIVPTLEPATMPSCNPDP